MPMPSRLSSPSRLLTPLLAAPLAALALAAGTRGACAAPTLQPGLWDYALQTRSGNGPSMNLAQMLRSLPASTRPQVEARLRAQGMSLGPNGNLQICLDSRSLAGGHPPLHLGGRCKAQWSQPSAGDWRFHYTCADPVVDGRGELRISSPTSYTSSYTVKNPQGSMSGQAQAHWVAKSCGAVPPLRETR